jgi:hypothetical protein
MSCQQAKIANYNFKLIQGDSYVFKLYFFRDQDGIETPEDLTEFDNIIWSFRSENNINTQPFEVKSIENEKLKIEGDDNNILVLEFDEELYSTQLKSFYHACLFVRGSERVTRINGILNNQLNTVKLSDE